MITTFSQCLWTMQVDGPSLSNSNAATSLLAAPKYTFNTCFFQIGSAVRIKGAGRLSNIVTTPGTFTLDVRFGGTVVFNGGAMQLSTTAHTTLPFTFEILLTCRAIGTSANLMGQGFASGQPLSLTAVADSTTTVATLMLPNTAPAVGNNFDSSATQQLDVFGTFSIANAGNLAQLHQVWLESVY